MRALQPLVCNARLQPCLAPQRRCAPVNVAAATSAALTPPSTSPPPPPSSSSSSAWPVQQQQQQQQQWRLCRRRQQQRQLLQPAAATPQGGSETSTAEAPAAIAAAAANNGNGNGNGNGSSNGSGTHIDCVATGIGDVQCFIADDDDAVNAGNGVNGVQQAAGGSEDAPQPPKTLVSQLLSAALLVSPFFFWGTSMVAMKPVTAHTTPLLLGAMRLLPAGLALVAWAAATGRPTPRTPAAWAWIAAFALVDGAGFQGFLAEGLQRTSAGLGSVIIDSQPLTVALLAALLFGEALSPLGVAGLFVGVGGLLLLEVPPDVLRGALASLTAAAAGGSGGGDDVALMSTAASTAAAAGGGGGWSLLDSGEFWMLLAAQSMAVGTVMVRWVTKHADPVAATAWHMVLGGAALAGAAVASDAAAGGGELAARLAGFSAADAAAMAYVSLLGGAASYGVFFYEATHGSLTAISSLTFLTPVFACLAGYVALGETLSPLQLGGAAVTLAAVFLINAPGSHTTATAAAADEGGGGGDAATAAAADGKDA